MPSSPSPTGVPQSMDLPGDPRASPVGAPAQGGSAAGTVLDGVLALTESWHLSPHEECALLGAPDSQTLLAWRRCVDGLPADVATRVRLLLEVARLDESGGWLLAPRRERPYLGQNPLRFMIGGGIPAMRHVRRDPEAASRSG